MTITMTDIISILRKVADISLVWLVFYLILKNIKNNVKLSLLFKGIIFIVLLKLISNIIGLNTVGLLLEYAPTFFLVVVVVRIGICRS